MGETSGVLKRGRKFEDVLDGARAVFMSDGFEGASMDEISRVAGVSKATVYSYFPDKRVLFSQVVQREIENLSQDVLEHVDDTQPARALLSVVAEGVVRFILSDFVMKAFRICLAEKQRFPELGRAFYEAVPKHGSTEMVDLLQDLVARNELSIDDLPRAADQFQELCKTRLWNRAAFGIQTRFDEDEIQETVTQAVDMFLARYQPR